MTTDKLYSKLMTEYNKGNYSNFGCSFNSFIQVKIEVASERGNYSYVCQLQDVLALFENDFY